MMKQNKKGFTIVELVIVIAVIAVLAAVLIPTFAGIVSKANESAAMQAIAAAYKEAYALALADDGNIIDGDSEEANGFTFTFTNNGADATVAVPNNFGFASASIVGGKVILGAPITPGGGNAPEDETTAPSPATYNVTKPATVTGDATVSAGATYTATVTADTGYNIVVTMGGQIVANAYSETSLTSGTITVANVTGDIKITVATATNLADPNDVNWKADHRISNSAEGPSSMPGWTVTNYFAIQNGDTVYIKNFDCINGLSGINDTKLSAYYSDIDNYSVGFNLRYGAQEHLKYVINLDYSTDWQHFTVNYNNANYMRLCGQLTANKEKEDVVIIIKRDGKWIAPEIVVEENEPTEPAEPKVIYTIGDSITNGKNGDDSSADRWTLNSGWLKYVVTEENGFDTVNSKNLGISGIGFKTNSANCPNVSIRDVIECTDALENASYTAGRFGDYTLADADIITVALGINDWKNSAVTVDAYFAEMEYCLARIREINPTCEIYYIMPFNIKTIGSVETNYALNSKGESNSNLCYGNTLAQFKQMIRDKFTAGDFGDVQLIDIEPFTATEMDTYLPDKIHPNADGYAIIGQKLAEALR